MQMQRFEYLSNRLLSAGVSPRHVRRYIGELRDHFDDALRDEQAKGVNRDEAERSAWTRLGDEDHLAQSVLSRPELRSLVARYPRLIFGAGPLLLWIALFVGTIYTLASLFFTGPSAPVGPEVAERLGSAVRALLFFLTRPLPVIVGAAMIWMAVRQRLASRWPLIGTAIFAVITGTTTTWAEFSTTAGQFNELQMSSSLAPFLVPFTDAIGAMNGVALAQGLVRGAIMFALMLVPYLLQQRAHRIEQS
jgi:hypothetical protein